MKTLLKLFATVLVLIAIIIGCRKSFTEQTASFKINGAFTTKLVKQWYSRNYQRKAEWQTAWENNSKVPVWDNGVYQKMRGLEMLAFPLRQEKTQLPIPGNQSLTSAQAQQVAAAAQSKVVFIRNTEQEITVRVVQYVPDWAYLQQKRFNIGLPFYGKPGDDFTGVMIVRNWNETILTMRRLVDGKITKQISVNKGAPASGQRAVECNMVEYCMWYEDCVVVGDVFTDDCEEPYMDPTDCFIQEECTGVEDDPCEAYGIGCGGGDDGGNDDPPPPADPCADAQPGADKAKATAQTNTYLTNKSSIQTAAANDNKEHSVTFGKDNSGNITASSMTTGGSSSGTVNSNWPNAFADLHNHPDDQPPSPGDLMGLIGINNNHSGYDTRYVVNNNGTVYALLVVDLAKANAFKTGHPLVQIGNYPPDFPDPLFTEFDDARVYFEMNGSTHEAAEEKAMALILDKYDSGVALLKQDANGNFKRLGTSSTTGPNGTTYTVNNCQ